MQWMSPLGTDLLRRFRHPHYFLNAWLALPFPLLLALFFIRNHANDNITYSTDFLSSREADHDSGAHINVTWLVLPPVLMAGFAGRVRWNSLESLFGIVANNARLLNLWGLYIIADVLGIHWLWSGLYLVCWLAISFLVPQPMYLGPTKVTALNKDLFEQVILFLPPSPPNPSTIKSTRQFQEVLRAQKLQAKRLLESDEGRKFRVVLFWTEWSKKARDVECTIGRMSWTRTSDNLEFHILPTDGLDPSLPLEYGIDPSPSSTHSGIPTLILFRGGKEIARLPRLVKKKKSEDDGEIDLELENKNLLERFGWDGSEEGIVKEFKLDAIGVGTKDGKNQ